MEASEGLLVQSVSNETNLDRVAVVTDYIILYKHQ